jgi:chromosome segregation ATPase
MKKDDSKKKNDEFLKSSALRLIELERSLIQSLGADDANDELDELKARIENYDGKKDGADDGRGSIIQRMSIVKNTQPQNLPKKNLAPERALNFALKSLHTSIEYFGEERELFISKQEDRKKETEKKEAEWQARIQELEDRLAAANDDRDLEDRCQRQAEQIDSLQTLTDCQEELEGERDTLQEERHKLADQCQNYEAEIIQLESEREALELKCSEMEFARNEEFARTEAQEEEGEEESVGADVGMLENRIEELEAENDTLAKQCEEQAASISLLQKEDKLEKFDKGLKEKAGDFKVEEYRKRLIDLQAEHVKVKGQCRFQQRKIEEMEKRSAAKDNFIRTMQQERERDGIKTTALEDALQMMGAERSRLLSQLQDVEDLNEMLRFKCDSQQDAIVTVKKDTGLLKKISLDINNESLEEIEDDRERLSLRCSSLEVHIAIFENEIAVLESEGQEKDRIMKDMKNFMKKFTSTVSTDRDHVDSKVKALDP